MKHKRSGNRLRSELAGLYERYLGEFITSARRDYNISIDEAAEVYRESFIALYHNISSGRMRDTTCSIRTMTFLTGAYKILNGRRREADESYTDISVVMQDHFSSAVEWSHRQEVIYDVVCAAAEPCNRILSLFYGAGKTLQEIAVAMDYETEHVAKNRKSLCSKKLRESICLAENRKNESEPSRANESRAESYLRREMDPEDQAAFESQLDSVPDLAWELDTVRHIQEAFIRKAERGALKELLGIESEKEFIRVARIGKRLPGRKSFLGRYSGLIVFSLACVAVALLIYGYMPRYSSASLFREALSAPSYRPVQTGIAGVVDADLEWHIELAGQLYESGDYEGALGVYSDIFTDFAPAEIPEEVVFHYGISCLMTGNNDKAMGLLNMAMQSGPDYSQQAEWYFALARLVADERLAARELFEDIHRNGESPYSDAAGELIERIKTKRWF